MFLEWAWGRHGEGDEDMTDEEYWSDLIAKMGPRINCFWTPRRTKVLLGLYQKKNGKLPYDFNALDAWVWAERQKEDEAFMAAHGGRRAEPGELIPWLIQQQKGAPDEADG
jgi:hypothetical protein